MKRGIITRFEEITRCPLEIQDSLISIMSDRVLNIPELGEEGLLFASSGFNVIATANTRDKGINEMSSALKRRFNFETVEPIRSVALESRIITDQCQGMLAANGLEMPGARKRLSTFWPPPSTNYATEPPSRKPRYRRCRA